MLGRDLVPRLLATALLGTAMSAVTVAIAALAMPADVTTRIASIWLAASAPPLALAITTTLNSLRGTSPRT